MPKIYTRTGDAGETSLLSGGRVSKDSARIGAYGTVDELNSLLGVIRCEPLPERADGVLESIQESLFTVGAVLADRERKYPQNDAAWACGPLEDWIDEMESELPPLTNFILPGGSRAAALAHLARAVCRRAERRVQALAGENLPGGVLPYINRLSDALFVLARWLNLQVGVEDVTWNP